MQTVKMKDNLIMHYCLCDDFNYMHRIPISSPPNELIAQKEAWGWMDYFATKQFLKSIEGKVITITRCHGDAFEVNDNNYWLPDSLFEVLD